MYDNLKVGDTVYLLSKVVNSNRYVDLIETGKVKIKDASNSSIMIEVCRNFTCHDFVSFEKYSYFSDSDSRGLRYQLFEDYQKAKDALKAYLSTDNIKKEVEKFIFAATPEQLESVYIYFLKEEERKNEILERE